MSSLQAAAARAVPTHLRNQLPKRALRDLNCEFDIFCSLIYVKFKLKTENSRLQDLACDIFDRMLTFESAQYTNLLHIEKLTVDMIYLRMKHYMGSPPPTPIVSDNEAYSEYSNEESEYSDDSIYHSEFY